MAAAGGAGGEAWRVAFLGAGNMATAMIKGLVSSGTLPAASVSVSSPSGPSAELVALGVRCVRANAECVVGADAVVLAVKPFNVEPALLECMAVIPPGALIVSLAAGVTCDTIQTVFSLARPFEPSRRIVRVMPNTPCAIGAGASGMARGLGATDTDMAFVGRLMRAVGVVHEVKEAQLDGKWGVGWVGDGAGRGGPWSCAFTSAHPSPPIPRSRHGPVRQRAGVRVYDD